MIISSLRIISTVLTSFHKCDCVSPSSLLKQILLIFGFTRSETHSAVAYPRSLFHAILYQETFQQSRTHQTIYSEHNLKPQHIKGNKGSACTSLALYLVAAVFLSLYTCKVFLRLWFLSPSLPCSSFSCSYSSLTKYCYYHD